MKRYADYIGIPFVNLGRSEFGADCWGLVCLVLKDQYGILLPELLDYDNALDSTQTSLVVAQNQPLIVGEKLDQPEEGDLVLMTSRGVSGHIGVYIGNNLILHTTKQTGAVTEPLSSRRLKTKIKGFYRVNKSYYTEQHI